MEKNMDTLRGMLVQGDLTGMLDYLRDWPEQAALYRRAVAIYEQEQYVTYNVDSLLNGILGCYQRYYRDAFYLRMEKDAAAEKLKSALAALLGAEDNGLTLDDLEQTLVAEAFESRGYHFWGGRTSGWYGPYIWREEELRSYTVTLPEGTQEYSVKLLDGFLSKSWMDYLSFGQNGTGGWAEENGMINCVKSAYDLESEAFRVSLLKHEAQHTRDLARFPQMSSEDLEYRAKLVELIYSRERNLLARFLRDAGAAQQGNGHALAANRILEGFARYGVTREDAAQLPAEKAASIAEKLFLQSTEEMQAKYAK